MRGTETTPDSCGYLIQLTQRVLSTPFMLHTALHCHLQKHSSPVTADIASNLYVDNIITGCATETEAVKYHTTARSILSKPKFNLVIGFR